MYMAGRETAPTTGTPHIQGFVNFPDKIRPLSLGLPTQISWRVQKGTRQQNVTYCGKDENYETKIKKRRANPKPELYGWQLELAEQLKQEPDNRTIFWYWSTKGGCGKSSMARWIIQGSGLTAIMAAGKAADMKHAVVTELAKGKDIDVCIFDVPRSSFQYLSYTGLEEIKNGVFYSSKYEGGQVCMPHPHVVVFANYPPDMNNQPRPVRRPAQGLRDQTKRNTTRALVRGFGVR